MKNALLLSSLFLSSVALVACNDTTSTDIEDSTTKKSDLTDEQKKHLHVDINLDETYSDDLVKQYAKKMLGTKAPDFSLENLKGETVNLSDLKGKNVIVEFASVSCTYCMDAYPTVNAFKNSIDSDDIELLTIFANDSKEDVNNFFTENNFEIDDEALAGSGMNSIFFDYAVTVTPTFLFIDKEGYIQYITVGAENSETDFSLMSDTYLGTHLMDKYNEMKELQMGANSTEENSGTKE